MKAKLIRIVPWLLISLTTYITVRHWSNETIDYANAVVIFIFLAMQAYFFITDAIRK